MFFTRQTEVISYPGFFRSRQSSSCSLQKKCDLLISASLEESSASSREASTFVQRNSSAGLPDKLALTHSASRRNVITSSSRRAAQVRRKKRETVKLQDRKEKKIFKRNKKAVDPSQLLKEVNSVKYLLLCNSFKQRK